DMLFDGICESIINSEELENE
ncbi:restriction endonuclease subunit S, partial [Salmonella enterica]|nr:restriction endonuclease subunit S [Salmonella enterica]